MRVLGLSSTAPYCGQPPSPAGLWARWNLDPVLIAVLLAVLAVYLIGVRRQRNSIPAIRQWAFLAGWGVLAAALISPLCPLSVSLFSARVGQHMILSLAAAPLLVLGRPAFVLDRAWPRLGRWLKGAARWNAARTASGSTIAFILALWFWHAPGPYAATFHSDIIYWLMHISVIGAALMVWSSILDTGREHAVAALAVGAASTLQMTFLGALITLTHQLLYAPHAVTPYAWGLTQASDQQIGGLIMWVPGCSVFLGATLYTLAGMMADRIRPPSPA